MAEAERQLMKAFSEPMPCRPNAESCWVRTHQDAPRFALLAANLKLAGTEGTSEDRQDLWDHHGMRNCLLAFHLADAHPELLPEPTFAPAS